MKTKKGYGEMVSVRDIEKTILSGLKKEGCQRYAKCCEICPIGVFADEMWVCNKARDLLKLVESWEIEEKEEMRRNRHEI